MYSKNISNFAMMKILVFVMLAFATTSAQDGHIDAEKIILPCCTKSQVQAALCNLYAWIFSNYNCDPLFQCIFKCLRVPTCPPPCPPNTNLHINFNVWLLNNYKCLPNLLLQCLKGCIQYNAYPPCPEIATPLNDTISPA